MKLFEEFDRSNAVSSNVKWGVPPPVHSMAWQDLNSGLISSDEKVKAVNLPPMIGRMMAEDARKRSFAMMNKQNETRLQWNAPTQAQPLMSLHLPPPPTPFFNPVIPKSLVAVGDEQNKENNWIMMNEAMVLNVLTQVNVIAKKIAGVMSTTVQARVERRKSDNAMCLFIHFLDFPWAIVGGEAVIDDEYVGKPPPPRKIYEAWRIQLLQSFKALLPPPLLLKMKRNIDKNMHMEWNLKLIASEDFRESVERVVEFKGNQLYERLWNTDPVDFDYRDTELVTMRAALMRQIETEVRSFWTYEKIGTYLRMNV